MTGLDAINERCAACGEPMEVRVVHPAAAEPDYTTGTASLFGRYARFYPYLDCRTELSLGEGNTPLVSLPRLALALGITGLAVKNETQNPTWSFKDRGTAASVRHAVALGYERFGTLSSGNMGASVAAFGARAGLRTIVLLKRDVPREKVDPIMVYGAHALLVSGDYHDLFDRARELGRREGIYFSLSDEPLRVEGYKTLAFEVADQTARDLPDYLVAPVGSGGLLRGIIKGFEELVSAGIIDRVPAIMGVQSAGCAPVARAFESGASSITRVSNPSTLDHVLMNSLPPSGSAVLRKVREHGGLIVAVPDREILQAQRRFALEGMFVQPASATALAGLVHCLHTGLVRRDARFVVVATGSGLKYPAALRYAELEPLETTIDALGETVRRLS